MANNLLKEIFKPKVRIAIEIDSPNNFENKLIDGAFAVGNLCFIISEHTTTIISIGKGASSLCEYLSFKSFPTNKIMNDISEIIKTI